jgi:hypothetical protein
VLKESVQQKAVATPANTTIRKLLAARKIGGVGATRCAALVCTAEECCEALPAGGQVSSITARFTLYSFLSSFLRSLPRLVGFARFDKSNTCLCLCYRTITPHYSPCLCYQTLTPASLLRFSSLHLIRRAKRRAAATTRVRRRCRRCPRARARVRPTRVWTTNAACRRCHAAASRGR